MRTLRLVVDLEYDDDSMHGTDPQAIAWFRDEVLGKEALRLHSNEIGDEVGIVRVIDLPNADL